MSNYTNYKQQDFWTPTPPLSIHSPKVSNLLYGLDFFFDFLDRKAVEVIAHTGSLRIKMSSFVPTDRFIANVDVVLRSRSWEFVHTNKEKYHELVFNGVI
jgi:hypothetical protein